LAFLSRCSTKALARLLVGVSARDPLTYVTVVGVLALTGALAVLTPARRAARVDPKIALSELA
jgi:ABC-type antimicrobial peptide transport system permease subunit